MRALHFWGKEERRREALRGTADLLFVAKEFSLKAAAGRRNKRGGGRRGDAAPDPPAASGGAARRGRRRKSRRRERRHSGGGGSRGSERWASRRSERRRNRRGSRGLRRARRTAREEEAEGAEEEEKGVGVEGGRGNALLWMLDFGFLDSLADSPSLPRSGLGWPHEGRAAAATRGAPAASAAAPRD